MTAQLAQPVSRTIFDVRGGALQLDGKPLLHDLQLRIGNCGCTVILGPSGTGKSCLLKALAGVSHDGQPVVTGRWARAVSSLAYLPQTRRPLQADSHIQLCARPAEALESRTDVVLMDEPDRQVMPDDRPRLAAALRRRASVGPIVLVTHDLSLAKEVADHVVFVCAGRIHHQCDAAEFFQSPPSTLAAQFLHQGNCWPKPDPPELPQHFRWVLPGKLAAMGLPGLMRDQQDDLSAIATAGVTLLVSLTEEPLSPALLRSYGIQARHLPIKDMHVPAIGPTARLCQYMESHIRGGGVVAVHCRAGLGRTGTVLASLLAWLGDPPARAIKTVRDAQPMALQTKAQEQFVSRFARDTASAGRPGSGEL